MPLPWNLCNWPICILYCAVVLIFVVDLLMLCCVGSCEVTLVQKSMLVVQRIFAFSVSVYHIVMQVICVLYKKNWRRFFSLSWWSCWLLMRTHDSRETLAPIYHLLAWLLTSITCTLLIVACNSAVSVVVIPVQDMCTVFAVLKCVGCWHLPVGL